MLGGSAAATQIHLWKRQRGIGRFGYSTQWQSFLELQCVAATLLDEKSATENIYKSYLLKYYNDNQN